jgi:putative ABC transport system permease protein
MNLQRRFIPILVIVARRLFAQRGLALITLLGLAAAISITVSIPMYTDAVFFQSMRQELSNKSENFITTRSPFSFYFVYNSSLRKPLTWAEMTPVGDYMTRAVAPGLGMPKKFLIEYIRTDAFKLYPQGTSAYSDTDTPLEWMYFATLSGVQEHVTLVEGAFPAVVKSTSSAPLEVMVSETVAQKIGVQAGELYNSVDYRGVQNGVAPAAFTVKIAGIWRATNPLDDFWFSNPTGYTDALFVPQESFSSTIDSSLKNSIFLVAWYVVLDGSNLSVSEVPGFLDRLRTVQQQASNLLPKLTLQVSPIEVLKKYQLMADQLNFMLYVISIPIMGLLLAFIGLVMSLVVGRQQNEIAVMRSRGVSIMQIAMIAGLEALLLGLLALAVSLPIGSLVASLMGRSRTFLDFSVPFTIQPQITPAVVLLGLAMVGLSLVAQVLPTIWVARYTIITYKQEQARMMQKPWWQRIWLDFLLLIPSVYGAYILRSQGSLVIPVTGTALPNDLFQNPLLLLVPALGIFSLTLFLLRILPYLMELAAWLVRRISGVGFLLAARHLSRTPGFYSAPLILLILTLSLSTYTASLAKTLDRFLFDQNYYQAGADVSLVQWRENAGDPGAGTGGKDSGTADPAILTTDSGLDFLQTGSQRWYFPAISEYLRIPGVAAATRVGKYEVTLQVGSAQVSGLRLIGVDRAEFPLAAYWRRDFAPLPLSSLMNSLAARRDGVLVTRSFMQRNGVKLGDSLPATLDSFTFPLNRKLAFTIVGELDLFPTWNPAAGSDLVLVGNLDYIFEEAGSRLPYEVWMKVGPQFDHKAVGAAVYANVGEGILSFQDASARVLAQQQRPERQGVFGVLSIGFAAGAVLTVVGFLLYALFSFRRRFIEIGVLRAIGLSLGQMVSFLAWELAILIGVGLAAGTGLGVMVSRLFIPYLQVGTTAASNIPPYVVIIAWPEIIRIYSLFGGMFVIAMIGLAFMLVRIKIFEAVKLGETV